MLMEKVFEKQGGVFITPAKEIAMKLKSIHAFVFDWDGVFNNGIKADLKGSPFSEPDSMGLNMLRFSYWLLHRKLPVIAIITGENNLSALNFSKREYLDAVFLNAKNKKETLTLLTNCYSLNSNEVAFVFDDILDLNVAETCLLSFCVRRNASPLFDKFIRKARLCNYISGQEGGQHAVREITELIIGLNGNYNETISKRMEYDGDYEQYMTVRNSVTVKIEKTYPNKS